MRNQTLFRNLFILILLGLITLAGCTPGITDTEPGRETLNSDSPETAVAASAQPESVPSATITLEADPTETEQATAAITPTPVPSETPKAVTPAVEPTETENADDEQTVPTATLPSVTAVAGLQVLVKTQDDSLAIWQNGALNKLADTAGVLDAVFVGNSDNIAYAREHEVWCVNTVTQVAHEVPLPAELVAIIASQYEYEAPDWITWLTSFNNNQVVATVFHGTGAVGTILVNCDSQTSQLIESANPGYPVLSPDNSKIAIAGRISISVYDIASATSKVLLEFEPIGTYSAAVFYPILSWSTDSRQVVTVIHPPDWWYEDLDEPAVVYRLGVEGGEVEAVASINKMFPRTPHIPVAYYAEKLAYSTPADPLALPFGYKPSKQMMLDISSGEETLLFEGDAGFIAWNQWLEGSSRLNGWNPAGDRLSFWQGTGTVPPNPLKDKVGIYDLNAGKQLERKLPGKFAGWLDDSTFLYTANGIVYYAEIDGSEINTLELTDAIDYVYQGRVIK